MEAIDEDADAAAADDSALTAALSATAADDSAAAADDSDAFWFLPHAERPSAATAPTASIKVKVFVIERLL